MSTSQRPVTIAGWPWIGNVFTYRRRKSEFLSHLRDDGRALTAFKLGGHKIILLKRPEDILHVEQRNAKNYVKATMLRDLVGDGILMSEGEKWRRQRRLIQPHFHPGPVAALEALMLKRISTFLTDLEQRGSTPIDLGIALKRLVFGIVLEALFGETREEDFDELLEPMITVNEFLTSRFNELLPLPLGFPIPRYRKFQNAKSSIDRVIYRYIEIKKSDLADGRGGGDLLTKMIQAEDPVTGLRMDDLQIRDEAVSILLAGFETTGNLLAWAFVLLGSHPQKLSDLTGAMDEDAVGAILDETLRLYPSVWAWTKRALDDDDLNGVSIKKGDILFLSPYLVHRDPKLWPRPEEFDPARWTSELRESLKDERKGAYIPFGLGPRTCVGRHFAILEAKLILTEFLKNFDFSLVNPDALRPDFKITLGLRDPLWVRVQKIKSDSNRASGGES